MREMDDKDGPRDLNDLAIADVHFSLIGRASDYPPLRRRRRSQLVLLFGIDAKAVPIMGFEDEVERSFGRPCR